MHKISLVTLLLMLSSPAFSQQAASDSTKRGISAVLLHPLFNELYACSEHAAGELKNVGDDLGQDCFIQRPDPKTGFMRSFKGSGLKNQDWYGWNKSVLSPCNCSVIKIIANNNVNLPGKPGNPPAYLMLLEMPDKTRLMIAHIQRPAVKEGDTVISGQDIARVGNNGFARMPHIHVGAWQGNDALQIRWDQKFIPIL